MRRQQASLLVATAIALGGCVTITSGTPPTPLPDPSLTTVPATVCHPTTLVRLATLRSDPADPHAAWLESFDGQRFEVVWPTGYHAQFTEWAGETIIEVSDAKGRIFIGTGDQPGPNHLCDAGGRPNTVLLMQEP